MSPTSGSPKSNDSEKARATPFIATALDLVGKVLAPTTILTALLFYIGWARSNALYQTFGVDQTVLGFSIQDYLLRSIEVAFSSLRWIFQAALVALLIHLGFNRFRRWLAARKPRLTNRINGLIVALGTLLVVAQANALLGVLAPLDQALIWTFGVILIGYGVYLSASARATESTRGTTRYEQKSKQPTASAHSESAANATAAPAISPGMYKLGLWLSAALLVLGMFWVLGDYAEIIGQELAKKQIQTHMEGLPNVTVYSRDPLNIEINSVTVARVSTLQNAYQYRYNGLKFLVRSNSKYFLLPSEWSPAQPVTIILPDTDSIRVELAPGTTAQP